MKFSNDDKIVVLTGAGISAESGIQTFRGAGGLWGNYRVEEVATPEAFARKPTFVWKFYKERLQQLEKAKPNPGHYALKKLEDFAKDNFTLVTQNIDGLHRKAGNKRILEMHGAADRCRCIKCNEYYPLSQVDLSLDIPFCKRCGGMLRPDVVWFGEVPYHLDEIAQVSREADYFIVVGTSGVVYPAAGFVQIAKYANAITICVNKEEPANLSFFDKFYKGNSGEILPKLVDEWIMGKNSE